MGLPAGDRELVQIVDASLAAAASRAGRWLACRIGCTQCCHGAFAINALDAARLRAGMEALRRAQPDLAAAIRSRAQAWVAAYGGDFPGDPQTGRLDGSEAGRARFEKFANDAPCPALDPATGRCDVYASRPMTCRIFGPPVRAEAPDGAALGCCELCFVGATPDEVAACEMPVPHEIEAGLLREIGSHAETVVAFPLLA